MTNLEYMICEAERCGEINLDTRDKMLDTLYEATRFAKEIHRKNMSTKPEEDSPEYFDKLYNVTLRDSIDIGRKRKGKGLLEQQDLGRSAKRCGDGHPGYKKGMDKNDPEKNGKYLKMQHKIDELKKTKRDSEYKKKYEKQRLLSLKHRNDDIDKNNNYYKNSNRHNHYTMGE